MDIKNQTDSGSDTSPEKTAVLHLEDLGDHKMSKAEKIYQVDAVIARPDVTAESFAHLDLKKILRKIDMRLIPTLTILYLGGLPCAKLQKQDNVDHPSSPS